MSWDFLVPAVLTSFFHLVLKTLSPVPECVTSYYFIFAKEAKEHMGYLISFRSGNPRSQFERYKSPQTVVQAIEGVKNSNDKKGWFATVWHMDLF